MNGQNKRFASSMAATWAVLVLVMLTGCHGKSPGNVSGTVKFDGKPLTAGTITFFDEKNRATSSQINADGTYEVHGVWAGQAKIAVAVPLAIAFDSASVPGAKPMQFGPKNVPVLPAKYLDAETSGLTCDVRGGDQVHDIELTQ